MINKSNIDNVPHIRHRVNIKKGKGKSERGFSLVEMVVTMSLFLVVMGGVYGLIMHYGQVSNTKNSQIRMVQESRYIMSSFASELKDAGAILTLSNTGGFLAGKTPAFNGLLAMNNSGFPDGIIIASGDPEAVTYLTDTFTHGANSMTVDNTNVAAFDPTFPGLNPQWANGDKGIVISDEGFYVFSVDKIAGPKTINVRSAPVYYSGLLDTINYKDPLKDLMPKTGKDVTFPKKAPVIRLTNFVVYFFKVNPQVLFGHDRNIRQWIRLTDSMGESDVLAEGSLSDACIISENIYDMQISYISYEDFTAATPTTPIDPAHYFFGPPTLSTGTATGLINDIRGKALKQITVDVVAVTGEYAGQGQRTPVVPPIGDQDGYTMSSGKYGIQVYQFHVKTRNYNINL